MVDDEGVCFYWDLICEYTATLKKSLDNNIVIANPFGFAQGRLHEAISSRQVFEIATAFQASQ